MHFFNLALAFCAAQLASAQTTGKLGDAMAITNNPPNGSYIAMFPRTANQTIRGMVTARSARDGKGVMFNLDLRGLPAMGGPFSYHIHDQPVPASGSCAATLAHLDPYQRGQTPACDASKPATCEVGDLSGKHGKINGTMAMMRFTDNYAALVPGIGAFFGNRSIVIHNANTTRIACANFQMTRPMGPPGMGPGGHDMD